jgi:hypothetical protein
MPLPGSGIYHANLLRVANYGIAAGVAPADLFKAIRAATPCGTRTVPDGEIEAAVTKAAAEIRPGQRLRWTTGTYKPARPAFDAGKFLRGLLASGDGATVEDLRAMSPHLLEYASHAEQLLEALYAPTDVLFIGDTNRVDIRAVHEWMDRYHDGYAFAPQIIPNPLSGQPGRKKDGGWSYRCDGCVAKFRFAVVEFDQVPPPLREPGAPVGAWPIEAQAQFWAGAIELGWPVAALIHSGGKSIHAWLTVNAVDVRDWELNVEQRLFAELLVPLGVDSTCKNESRLSRMPGAFRAEKGQWQRLLYLNPNAGGVKT